MSFEIYQAIVKDESSRTILDYCRTPRTTDEVITKIWHLMRAQYTSLYQNKSDITEIVATRLGKLESVGALIYQDGTWQRTNDAVLVLQKYFGLR